MYQENLRKKYGITSEQFKAAVEQIEFGNIVCDGIALVALVDLVSNGDIPAAVEATTAKGRVENELAELKQKIDKLEAFTLTPAYPKLDEEAATLLIMQKCSMEDYAKILEYRLKIWREI